MKREVMLGVGCAISVRNKTRDGVNGSHCDNAIVTVLG